MSSDSLEDAADAAFARLEERCGDVDALSPLDRTIVIVYSAQGVLDNGGLEYFFSNDWPGAPRYANFVDAYREIGAGPEADAIARAAARFPFPDPEADRDRRLEAMDEAFTQELEALEESCTSDVWALLAAHVRRHATD